MMRAKTTDTHVMLDDLIVFVRTYVQIYHTMFRVAEKPSRIDIALEIKVGTGWIHPGVRNGESVIHGWPINIQGFTRCLYLNNSKNYLWKQK